MQVPTSYGDTVRYYEDALFKNETAPPIENEFTLYCPYKNAYTTIRATSLTAAIVNQRKQWREGESDFKVLDVIFARLTTNPVFVMLTVDLDGHVSRRRMRIEKDGIEAFSCEKK